MSLPETFRGTGAFREIADFMRETNRRFNNFRWFGPGRVIVERDRVLFYNDPVSTSSIFDLYDIGTATCKIRGTGHRDTPTTKLFYLRGSRRDVTGGTYELDAEIDLSSKASGYLYLLVTRADPLGTVTLEHAEGDDPPIGGAGGSTAGNEECFPLWYVPTTGSAPNKTIVTSGIEDWRPMIGARIAGMV